MDKDYGKYTLFLKALADETRINIFDMLSNGELCPCDILEEFNITQPTLSYHMKILCESELVHSRKDGVWMKYITNQNSLELLKNLFDDIEVNIKTSN